MLPISTAAILLALTTTPLLAQRVVRDSLPAQRVAWELVPVPGGEVTLPAPTGPVRKQVPSFKILGAEVPWDLYDILYLRLDVPRDQRTGVDARTRPSRPHGAPDRGFGNRDYADGAPHPIATRAPDRLGLYDLLGNVGEWVTAEDGTPVLRGGSFLTLSDALSLGT